MTGLLARWRPKPSDLIRPGDADDVCVIRWLDGRWQTCWWRRGLVPEPFGPSWETAGEAIAVSRDVRDKLGWE
jgi:hypothetical protein